MPSNAAASSPHSRSAWSDHVVATRLPLLAGGLRALDRCGDVGAAGPLPVGVLQREQACPELLGLDACAGGLPDLGWCTDEVALDLPAQCRVGVEQPVQERRVERHAGT